MDCSTSGFPLYHQLLELAQTHVHWFSDTIQPSHPLSSPSPPAFNLSQHQGLFKWSQFFTSGGHWCFSFSISTWVVTFFIVQLSHLHDYWKVIALTRWNFVGKLMSLLFNMLSRLVITFLPRSKRLLISWLQSPSAVILEPQKIKSATVSMS